jgi:transposase
MATKSAPVAEETIDDIRQLLQEAERRPLSKEECDRILNVALSYFHFGEMLADKSASIAKLRKLLFGSASEKTTDVLGKLGLDRSETTAQDAGSSPAKEADTSTQAPKGHGRNGAADYHGATHTCVEHGSVHAGDRCPKCSKGKIYKLAEPAVIVRVSGGPPLHAHVWDLARLRCNLCGAVFTAEAPKGLGEEKYDETAASMIGLLRYGTGLPFNRLERLERDLGIPLPASTQWDIAEECAKKIEPAFTELIRQAAQGEVVHNDDTSMEILALRARLRDRPPDDEDKRTGIFTTGIVARVEDTRIALFFTGRQHAGENLAELLKQRARELPPPMQMCDGLAQNLPKDLAVILGNCLVHGRRQFVDVFDNFPGECRHVLEALREVYRHDALAKAQGMSASERLLFHQAESGPVMVRLKQWLEAQIEEHKVEPNSSLGKAITYMQKRWEPLTLFLRRPGAPLDNNLCEQALKRAIIHRKNSLFYKTEHGAKVGDIFMSLIHTAELCGANPFDYLTELQRHADHVQRDPAAWMPWNYKAACAADPAPE